MRVLKFGGSSVANAENISRVIHILQQSFANNDQSIIVLSALGGITDSLIEAADLSATGDIEYKEKLAGIEQRHLQSVKQLIPIEKQSAVLSMVKKKCNELEDILNGVFLLSELSPRIKDMILCYGEILSSKIFSAKLNVAGIENVWKDSRENNSN